MRSTLSRLYHHRDLLFSVICGILLFTNRIVRWTAGDVPGIDFLLLGAYFFGGYYTFFEVIQSLRKGRFNIDLLMIIAALGAAVIGAYAEGALLLFLFSLGHALEHLAMDRAKKAIRSLADLAPETAAIIRNGETTEVPVEELSKGDLVRVRPGERFPTDGYVVKGSSAVDQSPITGESIPVEKTAVDKVMAKKKPEILNQSEHIIFAGTINGNGLIEMEVTKEASESTLARVIKLIQQAEKQKSPTQRFASSFEKWFVPIVLVFVFIISFAFLVLDEPFRDSFYRAMTVLVGASPCALAISTPSAILSGIARSARLGILIKGGAPLENLGMVRAIAFDKTGTITEGQPHITDILSYNGFDEKKLLTIAAAAESTSDHPLAKAIVQDAEKKLQIRSFPPVETSDNIQGKGIVVRIDGKLVEIGKAGLFNESVPQNIAEDDRRLKSQGRTTVILRFDGLFIGLIGLMDTPRPDAKQAIARLNSMGIEHMSMLSGDHQLVADSIAAQVGLTEAKGDLLPDEKLEWLRQMEIKHRYVAMIGDGINDGPALAGATVGVAMGVAGSDVALETADVALMANNMNKLPTAIALSRATRKIIKQNIFISLGMIAFLVPAALTGLAGIGLAVFLHEGSTIAVVLNALRLLGWNDKIA